MAVICAESYLRGYVLCCERCVMAWKRALFKGKKVWVEVDENGNPVVSEGKSKIRYSNQSNTSVYTATARNVQPIPDAAIEQLSAPQPAQASKKASGFGSAKTRTAAQAEQARESAQRLLQSFASNAVICFTDGSCQGNPGPAGLGVLMQLSETEQHTESIFLGQGTNNVAELSAIETALKMVEAHNVPDERPVEILTDSKYSHGILTLNWKPKANQALVQRIKQRIKNRGRIRIHWVAGHAGIPQNERADELANQAIENAK